LVLFVLVWGCGREDHATHPVPSSPLISGAEPGQPGGRFLLASANSPKTFNPLLALDAASDGIVRLLFSSLIHFDQTTQEPGPGLAESWKVEPDQKTWTLKLRKGLHWSNGQPLTAEDVSFTWNEIMYNPQFNQVTFGLFQVGGKNFSVTNLDDVTVQVVTPEVYAPFLEFFGSVAILPKHALAYTVTQKTFLSAYGIGTPPARVVGCGPYRLKESRPGQFTLLERNPEFWMIDKQGVRLPYFKEVKVIVSGSPTADSALFRNGKSDAYEMVRPAEFEQFTRSSKNGRFKLMELGAGAERDFLWFNQNTGTNRDGTPIVNPVKLKWFRNRKFRQAFSCAIDRERMVREVYGGRGRAAYSFLSTENPKWNNVNVPTYSFDPVRAKALLAEIGIQDRKGSGIMQDDQGNTIEILFISNVGNSAREKAASMIQEDLRKIGINLIYTPVPFEVLRNKVDRAFDYECALMGLGGGGVDPATQMNVLRSSEDLHQWFPFQASPSTDWEAHIDALMDGQMRSLDFGTRKKAFDEVQMILAEELPMIYTVSPFCYAAIRSTVGNLRPSSLTPYRLTWNIQELYFRSK